MPRRLRLLARSIAVAFVASVLVPWAAAQQTERKPPPRLPPTGSQTSNIPAGVDTGTPATSDSMPLGTPVPPAAAADRNDQNKRSAAARSAARPTASASAAISEAAAASEAARPVAAPVRPVPAASAVRPARSPKPSPPAR
jgi:hypothetical protein